jgi:PAS domain S-box-containing protein
MPLGLFLVPVLYASAKFGTLGGVVFAVVATAVVFPLVVGATRDGQSTYAWFEVVELSVLYVIAYFVGTAVTAEREARRFAEIARVAHRAAEDRYRGLFETNSEPILLVDSGGEVVEANEAALELFLDHQVRVVGRSITTLVGEAADVALRPYSSEDRGARGESRESWRSGSGSIVPVGTGGALYRVIATPAISIEGEEMCQVVLQDTTEEANRRMRIEAFATHVQQAQEDERRRIAQELHDGPLQSLVRLLRAVDDLEGDDVVGTGRAATPEREGWRGGEELRPLIESIATEVRRISQGLRPPLLDDLGLVAALKTLCDETERRGGVAVLLRVELPSGSVSSVVELALFRMVQEALENIVRHAMASTVSLELSFDRGVAGLVVRDDGEGFDPSLVGRASDAVALGLTGIAERAESLGGSVVVRSARGEGTILEVKIPVDTGDR